MHLPHRNGHANFLSPLWCRRKQRYQSAPRNIHRHVLLSEVKEAMSSLPLVKSTAVHSKQAQCFPCYLQWHQVTDISRLKSIIRLEWSIFHKQTPFMNICFLIGTILICIFNFINLFWRNQSITTFKMTTWNSLHHTLSNSAVPY